MHKTQQAVADDLFELEAVLSRREAQEVVVAKLAEIMFDILGDIGDLKFGFQRDGGVDPKVSRLESDVRRLKDQISRTEFPDTTGQ